MTQNVLSACCISGHLHEGTAEGTEMEISGLKTYIASPPDGSKAKCIVLIHDIFGYGVIACLLIVYY